VISSCKENRMNKRKTYYIFNFLVIIALLLSVSCNDNSMKNNEGDKNISQVDEIKSSGKIVAITDYNSTNYFVYRGRPMGYQYELLQSFANYLGVKLEVIVSNDLDKTFTYLQDGDCDIIAVNLTVTKERSKRINFTEPHSQTRQVLVQRKPDGWRTMSRRQIEARLLKNQLDLAKKTIYVQKGSIYFDRLQTLSDEIGDSIQVVELPNYETEQLIKLVAEGEIEYTVCDEIVGLVNKTYFPNIDVSTAISFPQNLAWAVRKGDDELRNTINAWLIDFKKTAKYRYTFNKYFKNSRSVSIVQSEYYSNLSGKISEYDKVFKKESEIIGWDWRLLASLVYQESHFNANIKSWAGAFGLMQLMPSTAKRFGVDTTSSPIQNVEAGVKFINWLDKILGDKIEDKEERTKFILASYNVGLGHILDARRLAKKYGKDPNVWEDNVDFFILNKSNPEYYHDPVVKYGYCRGEETYKYVNEILNRYEHYKNAIED